MILWKLGGAVCNDAMLQALAAGHDGTPWVITHGGGPQLDAALAAYPLERIEGLRVTSAAAATTVRATLDAVGADMVAMLRRHGVPAVHVPAASGWLAAVEKDPSGRLGRVGAPIAVELSGVQAALAAGQVPVVTPVGYDTSGPLNVNADEAAQALAGALQAEAMYLVTDVPNVRGATGPIAGLDPDTAESLIRDGIASGGMVPKLRSAQAALAAGIPRVAIGTVESLLAGSATVLAAEVIA